MNRRPPTSDSFFPYPKVVGGPVTPVRGILAGSPDATVGGAPPLQPLCTGTAAVVVYVANIAAEPSDQLITPAGDPSLYKWIQVTNQGAGFTFVAQGQLLGVVPPFSFATFVLYPGGGPVSVFGWDGGDAAVTGTTGALVIVWTNTLPLQTEMSWTVPVSGGSVSGSPFREDESTTAALVYAGFDGIDTDSWSLTFTGFATATGAVTTGKIGFIIVQTIPDLTLTLAAPAEVQIEDQNTNNVVFADTIVATGAIPVVPGGFMTESAGAAMLALPASWAFTVRVRQGGGSLGGGALASSGGTPICVLFQGQLQA